MTLHDPTHLCDKDIPESTLRKAKVISAVTQPQFFSIILFALICLVCDDVSEYLCTYLVCVFFGCILPIIEVLYYSKKFHNTDGDVEKKEDRLVPLLLGTSCYVLGAIALWLIDAEKIITVLFVCYAVVTFAITLVTPYWKISIHSCGMIGPSMALVWSFGILGAVPLVLVPFICWARYVQRKHTPAQLAGGIVIGFVLTMIVFCIML